LAETSNHAHDGQAGAVPRPNLAARLTPLVKRLPWPLILLLLGISLAVVAIYLKAFERRGALPTFVAAAVALLAGLGGLMLQNARETKGPVPPEPQPVGPRIYREDMCGIELPVMQRLIHAVETLEERIKEKNWQVNQDVCRDHRDKGRILLNQGDLPGAFREDCRVMLLLMEAISKQRNKEECFKPLWDKAPA
jgi:hypothetical protein